MKALIRAAILCAAAAMGGCGEKPAPPPDITSEPQSARDHAIEQARAALQRGLADDAIARVAPVVREHPDDYEARVLLASAELMANKPGDALRDANLALAINARKPDAWVTKAAALTVLGEDAQAIEAGERAVEKDPSSRGALTNLATLYGRTQAVEKQRAALERLVALDDADLASRLALARLAIDAHDTPTAERLAKEIVARDPRYAPAQVMLAALAYDQDDYGAALERARIALTARPEDDIARTLLEASFYVTVGAELTCAHGPRPWQDDDAARVLTQVRDRYEVTGVSSFYDLDETYGPREDVQARVARAAKKLCPSKQ